MIERQVTHLVRLIDDLLDISRISHGKVGLRPERVSVASVVESALEAARPLLLQRRHALEVALPEAPVFLHGDPVRLAQILTNLLSNAAWYTEPGGRVRVEATLEGAVAVIRVVDSGIGIPADALWRTSSRCSARPPDAGRRTTAASGSAWPSRSSSRSCTGAP